MTYEEKLEFCQDKLNEELTFRQAVSTDLKQLNIASQIVCIDNDDAVEIDLYINDNLETLWIPYMWFEDNEGCSSLSYILFTFFEGVIRGMKLQTPEVQDNE